MPTAPAPSQSPDSVSQSGAQAGPPALRVHDVEFAYSLATSQTRDANASRPWSLRVPDLVLERGQQMLLVAPSGSGKSTLLSLITGLLDPARGTIEVSAQPIHALRGEARDRFRGKHIGVIFQTFNLLTGFSAIENVGAALLFAGVPHAEHAPRARTLLSALHVDRPESRVEDLSVGQQQRVAVARALATSPTLVLADEPTASLDPENAQRAIELIQSACAAQGAALLCVSHDPAMRARFSHVRSL